MQQTPWKIPDILYEGTAALEDAGYSKLLSMTLLARGIDTPEKAARHLSRDGAALSDPLSLFGMDRALQRLAAAISDGECVAVYGDYDVDGITASCLLCDYLKGRGLDCRIYIPDRIDEGYGLNEEALESLRRQGVSLVITVDCGITAVDSVRFANDIGLDIIITDHHECPPSLPECCAVVNPKRQEPEHPAYNLAGVGVALKLACALEGSAGSVLERYSDLVAVGTIADVMPLLGENRVLVFRGIEKLKSKPHPGLAALLSEAGAGEKALSSSVIGYTLAPRINAAGRLCETSKAVNLLMCGDPGKAQMYAAELCALNRRRQEMETEVWSDSVKALRSEPPCGPIVLSSEHWHPGVVGIAASRLAEVYRLPAIIICLDGENGKGSCRSFGDFNLFDALKACDGHLESFGGHAFAAGLNIKRENIDGFRAALSRYWAERKPRDAALLEPELRLADFSDLTIENVESLELLEPCGAANPRPLMCVCGVDVEELFSIGGGKHLRLNLGKNAQSVSGVFFAQTPEGLEVSRGDIADICFTPQINDFRSRRSVQLLISGVRTSGELALCREILEKPGSLPEGARNRGLSRDGLASLWRSLRGGQRFKLKELFTGAGAESSDPVKACLGLCVFAQLKLLELSFDGEYLELKINGGGDKARLEDSPLFCLLAENKHDE